MVILKIVKLEVIKNNICNLKKLTNENYEII